MLVAQNNVPDDRIVTAAAVHVQQTADRGHDLEHTICTVDVYGTPGRPEDIGKRQDVWGEYTRIIVIINDE